MTRRFVFDERFAQAILNLPTHRVLGKVLRPFSLWHKLQLEYHNSPVLTGADITITDLYLAVQICRTSYPTLALPKMPAKGWKKFLWMLWAERVNLEQEGAAFSAYVQDYFSAPKIESFKKGERVADMDDSLGDVALYRKMTGCPREEPWNIPIGELYWMNAAFSRSEGADFSIVTPIEEARKARLAAMRDAKIEEIRKRLIAQGIPESEAKAAALAKYRMELKSVSKRTTPNRHRTRSRMSFGKTNSSPL